MDVARRGLDAAQRSIVDATSHGAKYIQDKSHQGAQAVQKVAVEATTKRVQALQNATTHVASKGVQAVQQAIVGVGTKSAQVVQATTDSVKTRAKESAAYVHRHTTKKAVDAGSALVESSSAALKHTTERLHASTEHLRDPAKAARRVRNQVLLLVFSGIFVYGFASSLPSALAKYAVERQKHQQRTNDTVHAAERSKVV
ncbi:hypothetical protein DYB32_007140 [Aphanomyces invadans]|uniref:Uncharacterized protein n=1 Tax=Aphanomyces invadans TaxID=157072 RepID=A0A3R6VIF6_9STRA|nr:hypothetical protein DYB32_007140 [Aphanomyces invadans]